MNREATTEGPTPSERESLSALADGELAAGEIAGVLRRWASHESLRAEWRSHQVIGDVLRSDELAGRGDEARFLSALRVKLAAEPVVLAPSVAEPARAAGLSAAVEGEPSARRPGRRPRWAGGAAVAAGFAAVVGVLLSLDKPLTGAPGSTLAVSAPAGGAGVQPVTVPVQWAPGSVEGNRMGTAVPTALGPMIRDARIDAYLDAHRQMGPGSWMAIPTAAAQPRVEPVSR